MVLDHGVAVAHLSGGGSCETSDSKVWLPSGEAAVMGLKRGP